ncbi:iron-containing redox enzyme family protein [Erwinia psidii]|uniref:Iron-containing redox enzyme family protein n=1 Tax=Erwinia psidii TaxID=69224 RepID=A0A3N6UUB7_9GAMM|nr:iron-containing redox enzyme family protein [Erwinia psidii]MCX8957635.1 iron-containing redox enzyme family protein [Erwinia psidii]MCX8960689.1 iron-containing redox enzyme family protein [Erwinia psidii]MCX8964066.1 iron-containing redox enzyme family protein [Erwinia psidii]RQM39549.1 iron-containing redox enzyme family protein [Erwinia psidii]
MKTAIADSTTALPYLPFHFSPQTKPVLDSWLSKGSAKTLYKIFAGDIESEGQQLLALQLTQTLSACANVALPAPTAAELPAFIATANATLNQRAGQLLQAQEEDRKQLLRQRALLSLIAGCWLDYVSQPATEPAEVVCLLSGQNFALKGQGEMADSQQRQRYRQFAALGIAIPEVYTAGIIESLGSVELTAWQANFWLALSRLSASHLPEVVGFHYAYYSLGFDDVLLGLPAPIAKAQLDTLMATFLQHCQQGAQGAASEKRMLDAVARAVELELAHSEMLLTLKSQLEQRTEDDRMAEIVRRHLPLAGKQHQRIRLEKRSLAEWPEDANVDMASFLRALRASPYLRQPHSGTGECSFQKAVRFGGSMFGIFSAHEAATMARWIAASSGGAAIRLTCHAEAGSEQAANWLQRCRNTSPEAHIIWQSASLPDNRELFYQLVNIEHYASHLALLKQRVEQTLQQAEVLFITGNGGRYTDASYFDYTPEALLSRMENIYWEKLVQPYERLTGIPDRDSVLFGQKLMALGSMIDGAWAHRFGGTLRNYRRSDGKMLAIYADEMGLGDYEKNHITLILRVLKSMGINLPPIREKAFCQQDELPDIYDFSLHQLAMSQFPDTFYEELLGYNLGIEMLGLGEMRMHEIQKLRHYGFDTIYEEAHLTIDNFSAGHSRQAVDLIIDYLDDCKPGLSVEALQQRWRRIWRGYASFALYLENDLHTGNAPEKTDYSELLI